MQLKTNVKITLRNKQGKIISEQHKHNIVVNEGLQQVVLMLGCGGITRFRYIELGESNTAPSSTDQKLGNAISGTRVTTTIARTNFCANWTHTWSAGEFANATIREAGLFQQGTTDVGTYMLARLTFTKVNKTLSDTLTIDWDIGAADA